VHGRGLAELPDGFAERGIGWVLRQGEPGQVIPVIARDLGASLIVVDQDPTNAGRRWRAEVAEAAGLPMAMVDADVVVPTIHFPKLEFAPRTIRPKILRLLPRYLVPIDDPEPKRRSTVREAPDPLDLVDGLDIDRSVGPASVLARRASPSPRAARPLPRPNPADLRRDPERNDPEGMSGLSRYLHYGQISPVEVAVAASEAFH
jgi:deoxyribodipyrimidine photo-lyase